MVGGRHFDVWSWIECDCIGDSDSFGVSDPRTIASVVFHCGSEVPSFFAMGVPSFPVFGFFMDDTFDSWWGNWVSIIVVDAMKEFMGG